MQPTWKDDLLSLHQQRKNYLRSLRYLYEQSSKVSRASVTTHNEIEDIKTRLQEVEKHIISMQEVLGNEVENVGLRKLDGFSPYLSDEQDTELGDATTAPIISNQRYRYKDQKSYRRQLAMIILIILAAVTTITVLFLFLRSYLSTDLSSDSQISTDIPIYTGYYHLGDAYLQQFHSPNPQPNPFKINFQLAALGADPHLILTASDVDPNVAQSPVKIIINDNLVGYLNNYFTEEVFTPKEVSIPVDVTYLKIGENKMQIETQATALEYQTPNLDDFEFWDVKLKFSGEK